MARLAVGSPAMPSPEPPPPPEARRDPKGRYANGGCAAAASGAGARLLSFAVQAAVMAAALALFLLFAAAAAVLLLHLLVAARAFRHHRRFQYHRHLSAPPPLPPRLGLSPADLRLLPCFTFSPSASPSPPQLCAVCLEAARAGERWRALPACGHAFHAACVDRWLAKSPACPICRAAVAISVS